MGARTERCSDATRTASFADRSPRLPLPPSFGLGGPRRRRRRKWSRGPGRSVSDSTGFRWSVETEKERDISGQLRGVSKPVGRVGASGFRRGRSPPRNAPCLGDAACSTAKDADETQSERTVHYTYISLQKAEEDGTDVPTRPDRCGCREPLGGRACSRAFVARWPLM